MLGSPQARKAIVSIGLSCCGIGGCSEANRDPELNQSEPTAAAAADFLSLPTGKHFAPLSNNTALPSRPLPRSSQDLISQTDIPLEESGGTFLVPVMVNNTIALKFMIDSGASDVTIPSDVASTLVRSGTISTEDYVGSQTFTLADGSQVPSPEFKIRSLRVGSFVIHDVVATITGLNGSLLLGQTFLGRLKSWSIDNNHRLLHLEASSYHALPDDPGTMHPSARQSNPGTIVTPVSGKEESSAAMSKGIVEKYFSAWSDPTDLDGDGVSAYYGDPVSFYGKVISRSDLMLGQKHSFARRWPVRAYRVSPNSMRARCSQGTTLCTVVGIVDWSVASPIRQRHSSGTARFSLTLKDDQIVGESSKVLSRDNIR